MSIMPRSSRHGYGAEKNGSRCFICLGIHRYLTWGISEMCSQTGRSTWIAREIEEAAEKKVRSYMKMMMNRLERVREYFEHPRIQYAA